MNNKKIIWQDEPSDSSISKIIVYEDGELHMTENLKSYIELLDILKQLAKDYAKGVSDLNETFGFWQHNKLDDGL